MRLLLWRLCAGESQGSLLDSISPTYAVILFQMQTHAQNQGGCTRLSQSHNHGPLPPSPTLGRPVTHIRSAPFTCEKAFTDDDI